jgi:hypothetical protein
MTQEYIRGEVDGKTVLLPAKRVGKSVKKQGNGLSIFLFLLAFLVACSALLAGAIANSIPASNQYIGFIHESGEVRATKMNCSNFKRLVHVAECPKEFKLNIGDTSHYVYVEDVEGVEVYPVKGDRKVYFFK